ncbi:hypothetical protein P171DRAFT_485184 [Karstenula rhodostoma CBS 690.94]|uniref:Uncharacterized protein n=1 Tax=Karstenula rhodostoma CBS 690.94 TaxID=1392251 RepID=A0A9P4PHF1_9PLEO|nr:hypothetical protein P171DRAFT_485184 [Karstenula rhodostoma CBS 690.94]
MVGAIVVQQMGYDDAGEKIVVDREQVVRARHVASPASSPKRFESSPSLVGNGQSATRGAHDSEQPASSPSQSERPERRPPSLPPGGTRRIDTHRRSPSWVVVGCSEVGSYLVLWLSHLTAAGAILR